MIRNASNSTYSLIENRKTRLGDVKGTDRILRTGRTWEQLKKLEARLEAACHRAYPRQTSWTRPIFFGRMEPLIRPTLGDALSELLTTYED